MRITLAKANQLLSNGEIVAVPTETVYGLAASLKFPSAINQIFKLKGRPSNNPLIVHVSHTEQILKYVKSVPRTFDNLSKAFWPGPLTLVLPVDVSLIPSNARADLSTAAFRIPSHPVARALLEETGPLVMPSANLSGRPSATKPDHIETDFGADFPILDGGSCGYGLESTILYLDEDQWKIVRCGSIPSEAFVNALGYHPEIDMASKNGPLCPGQLYRHYAPNAKLYLRTDSKNCKGVVIGFSDRNYSYAARVFSLGPSNQPDVVAEHLYAILRQLDEERIVEAEVDMDFPQHGLWRTIAERLQRAAKPPF